MKKYTLLLIAIIFMLILSSCSNATNTNEEEHSLQRLTYSNLTDTISRDEVTKALEYAKIPSDNIGSFFRGVDYFNLAVEEEDLTEEGFTMIDNLEPEYDSLAMKEKWDTKNPEFIGYNCRITSYDLMKDSILIGKPDTENADWLMFDEMALEHAPEKLFDKVEQEQFRSLYSFVPTESTKDIAVHVKNVKEDWKKKEIEFKNDDRASLISVFFHEEEGYLFIGHIGVLLITEDGELLFLEKVGLQEPYQALKFNQRVELNDYLMNKYDISWNQPTAKPFIMENNELLEGYRESPNTKED